MTALAFVATVAGAALLCVSMRRHYRLWRDVPLSKGRSYGIRAVAYAALALGIWFAVVGHGTGIGLTLFAALFTVAMLATAFVSTAVTERNRQSLVATRPVGEDDHDEEDA